MSTVNEDKEIMDSAAYAAQDKREPARTERKEKEKSDIIDSYCDESTTDEATADQDDTGSDDTEYPHSLKSTGSGGLK